MGMQRAYCHLQACRSDALLLLARIFPAVIFWRSGRTKVEGFQLNDTAVFLFQEEYRLPLVDPAIAAGVAALAEHLLPMLLLLGLATRLSALGLLVMTLVIQLLVYPDAWPTHGTWAVALLLLLQQGGGRFSLDPLLLAWWRARTQPGVSTNPCVGHADPEQCQRVPR